TPCFEAHMKSIIRYSRAVILIIFAILSCTQTGCGNDRQLFVVTVQGDRTGIAALRVLVTLNGTNALRLEEFSVDTSDFGIELPPGVSGSVQITVAGFDSASGIVQAAAAEAQAGGSGRVDLTVLLIRVIPPRC